MGYNSYAKTQKNAETKHRIWREEHSICEKVSRDKNEIFRVVKKELLQYFQFY